MVRILTVIIRVSCCVWRSTGCWASTGNVIQVFNIPLFKTNTYNISITTRPVVQLIANFLIYGRNANAADGRAQHAG